MIPPAPAELTDLLNRHRDYRLIRRLQPVQGFHACRGEGRLRIGIALDVETTGLDRDSDCIIELAVQRFRFDEAGRIVEVGTPRVWREDPERELDPRITRLTGLSSIELAGQKIDEALACDILGSADLIVAHNAAFDRPFVEKRLPVIAGRAWACSMAELDWLDLGFDGRALAHLLYQCGWFYEGHRAESDILALLYLLAHNLPDGTTVLSRLLAASDTPGFRVNAVDAPFDAKDRLKARGYRWNATMRFWTRDIAASEADAERAWLMREVYHEAYGAPAFIALTACERYR